MSANSAYEIVESVSKGKVAIATRDLRPGEQILAESEPILFVDFATVKRFETRGTDHMGAVYITGYSKYLVLTHDAQERLMNLCGPTSGEDADNHRANFSKLLEMGCPSSPGDVEIYVKLCRVIKFNMFTDQDREGYAVFGEITRLSHSCHANCASFVAGGCTCSAIRFIREGEELTISYLIS